MNGQDSVISCSKTPMLRSDLCDYSDAYIVVNQAIDLLAATANKNKKADQDLF